MKNYLNLAVRSWRADFLFLFAMLFVVAVVFAIDSVLGSAGAGVSLAMAAGGSIVRNGQVIDGAGWDRRFSVSATYAALLENVMIIESDDNTKVTGWYNSSTAFTTNAAQYDGFPVGSIITDIVAKTQYMHQTATTWVANAYA